MTRTFVVGLDGGNWDLIDNWIESGDLPNIEEVRNTGSWAEHQSCLPPTTFPNWKCYSASKNPGKLGVFWFEKIDLENEEVEIPNGSDFETAEIWDYLNQEGIDAGVVNMPTMYPPRKIDGFVVCGGPDAVDGEYRSISSGYTYPSDLEEKLTEEYDYRVHPNPLLSSNEEKGAEVDEILELIDKRFEVSLDLFEEEELEFMHVTLFYLNVIQHFFWDDEPTKRAWKRVDKWIGRLKELDNTNLVLMSDHGCAETEIEFYINEWLDENDYLTQKKTLDDYFQSVGLTRENALAIAKKLRMVDILAKVVPESIQKMVPQEAGVKRGRKLEKIDMDKTKAVASGQGPVYLNQDYDVEEVREEIISDLKKVVDKKDEELFLNIFKSDEVYEGPYVEDGPEIMIDQRPGITINDGMGGNETQTKPKRWEAENIREGIFVANGPDFASKGKIDQISILDIAPTILALFGIDIPKDMDGKVLPVFKEGEEPEVGKQEPIQIKEGRGDKDEEKVEDRLKQLGYME